MHKHARGQLAARSMRVHAVPVFVSRSACARGRQDAQLSLRLHDSPTAPCHVPVCCVTPHTCPPPLLLHAGKDAKASLHHATSSPLRSRRASLSAAAKRADEHAVRQGLLTGRPKSVDLEWGGGAARGGGRASRDSAGKGLLLQKLLLRARLTCSTNCTCLSCFRATSFAHCY